MQATRHRIVEILNQQGEATVEELSRELGLTAVTVRHHLDILRRDGLIEAPDVRRLSRPGRPQYIYRLTEAAQEQFPKNYHGLAGVMLSELRERLDARDLDTLLRAVARRLMADAPSLEGLPLEQRLTSSVAYLNSKGYVARWGRDDEGAYAIQMTNCPYRQVAKEHSEVCSMDVYLIDNLLGTKPERVSCMLSGDERCVYIIPVPVA